MASDADHTEALGPPIAALLLALLPPGQVHFIGDSQHVVDLLTGRYTPGDLFSYHCVQLTRDLWAIVSPRLPGFHVSLTNSVILWPKQQHVTGPYFSPLALLTAIFLLRGRSTLRT